MKRATKITYIIITFIIISCSSDKKVDSCLQSDNCSISKLDSIIKDPMFDYLALYDSNHVPGDSLLNIEATQNELLYYREIGYPFETKFTKYWSDASDDMYYTNHSDFIRRMKNKEDVKFAFQMGPNGALWSYYTYIVREIDGCLLFVQTRNTHARFRYKSYTLLSHEKFDILKTVVNKMSLNELDSMPEYGYNAFFIDNCENTTRYIEFEKQIGKDNKPIPSLQNFFDYLNDSLEWKQTYYL